MTTFTNPFILNVDDYKRDINPLKHYTNDVVKYLSIQTGKSEDDCRQFVISRLSKGGKFEFKDKPTKYLKRLENGDREERVCGLNEYLQDSIRNKEIITPTLTTYLHPSVKESILAIYIDDNVKARSRAKKAMFAAEAVGDKHIFNVKKIEQTNRKLANNAISGAHVSPYTPLYNKTAHATLTSNCRSTSGYGNANNEKLLSGNRHYFNHRIVMNNIVSIINNTDYVSLENTIAKYNLYVPNELDVIDCIKYSTNIYWREEHYFKPIHDLVYKLTPIQRAAFVYTGDIYHLKKHNELFIRAFVQKLSIKVSHACLNAEEVLKNAPEDHLNLAHQICLNETRGIGKKYDLIKGTPAIHTVASTVINIAKVITEYADFIKTFLVTKNVPASVAHFPDSVRRCALTSDTDSTIFTVQDWVLWYNGKVSFDDTAMAVAATMIFLASATITHVLAMMSANFGIVKERLFQIAMKNEFKFDVFIPTQIGKHYFANISCQEGNVKPEHEVEIKGVHLKSSTAPRVTINKAAKMMEEIMHDVMTDGEVSVVKYLTQVANIERDVIASINKGEHTYLVGGSIKDPASYTKDKEQSPYVHHMFWNNVFGPKYGEMPEPPYRTMKVSVNADTTSKFKEWVASIKDREFATRVENWMSKYGKTTITTFHIPIQCLESKGMPEELTSIIDYRKIVKGVCNVFYIVLQTLGVYLHGDKVKKIASDDY